MRKIYSLVLMAAALLVGTNAWATTYNKSVATYQQLINAIEGGTDTYQAGDEVNITLTNDIDTTFTYDRNRGDQSTVFPKAMTSEIYKGQIINLNLNGHNINSKAMYVFSIYYGKLYITGQGTVANLLERYRSDTQQDDQHRTAFAEASVIFMLGINVPNCDPHRSYLNVGPEVNIMCNKGKCGVYVNQIATDDGTHATTYKGRQLDWSAEDAATYVKNSKTYHYKDAYGVYAEIFGTVHGLRYGLQMSGNINKKDVPSESNNPSLPTYVVHSGAVVYADNDDSECCGMYLGGYCRAIIGGTIYGSTGVYVKSGVVAITDAIVYSNWEGTDYKPASAGSGADAYGSGVVIDSNVNYAGEIDVTVAGDTKITGASGYALDEKVTYTTPGGATTQVTTIDITGGTFETGENGQGAITISEPTKEANEDKTQVTTIIVGGGTNVEGNVQIGSETTLDPVIPDNTYVTTVVDDNGKTTVVISTGTVPTGNENVNGQTGSINWKHNDASTAPMSEDIETNTTLDVLTMNQSYTQAIYVKPGVTLTVNRIMMGADAHIIVEPTGKLIVNGTEGIVTTSVTNLVLQANETSQGILLFNPDVKSNRQPLGQVQYTTVAYQMDANNYKWQRITSPLAEVSEITYYLGGKTTYGGAPFGSDVREWDYANNAWSTTSVNFNLMKPFVGYALTNNCTEAGVRYSFKGRIQGTVSDDLQFKATGFNYFGNAYTSSMHIKTMLANLNNAKVEGTVYVWLPNEQRYEQTNITSINAGTAEVENISALQTIILYLNDNASPAEMSAKMNYRKSVWEYGTNTGDFASPAPQRVMSNYSSVRMTITAADGAIDRVTMIEGDNYSEEYESGADARKLMNENHINFYAVTDMDQAIVATDNMIGTMLSLQTKDEVSYTISFDKVNGEIYALRDNQTNTVVLMNEGATYNFMAQSNATLDGRFQIVSRQEMPTAVETIDETIDAPKAIYTVMGQYVGETTDWNNLPAGVYVVDGVKIVK